MPDLPFLTRYLLNPDDEIVSVSESWSEFAIENDAPELVEERIVGQSLWRFISGVPVRDLYQQVIARVRANDTPIFLPFRCDSPGLRRLMRLVISPTGKDLVQFDAVLVRTEPRAPIALLSGRAKRSGRALQMCSWCKKVRVDREWLEVEDAVVRLRLFQLSSVPPITHGACAACAEHVTSKLS